MAFLSWKSFSLSVRSFNYIISTSLLWRFGPGWQQRTMQLLCRTSPPEGSGGELEEKGRTVGRDKDGLTEQQRKRTTTILIERIYNNKWICRETLTTWCPVCSRATITLPQPAPPLRTEHDVTWYWIPHLFVQFGSAGQLCPLLDSCEN